MSEVIEAYDELYNNSIPHNWWESEWRPTKFAYGSGPMGSGYMVAGANTTEAQMNNAWCILQYLMSQGWAFEAVCAILGNIQSEGQTQPGKWQSDNYGDMSTGFGLVQWTPASKYINWAVGIWTHADPWAPFYYSGWYECYRIALEFAQRLGGQWISTVEYPATAAEFATGVALERISEEPYQRVSWAVSAFMHDYERPASYGSESQRIARAWETYLRFRPLYPDYAITTRKLKPNPQMPGPYFKLTNIRSGWPVWWYKVMYMASRKGGHYAIYAK